MKKYRLNILQILLFSQAKIYKNKPVEKKELLNKSTNFIGN
jgi:hypothetical protein